MNKVPKGLLGLNCAFVRVKNIIKDESSTVLLASLNGIEHSKRYVVGIGWIDL